MPADREVSSSPVVVAGGGPTGLVLAAELTLAGVDVLVVERRPDQSLEGSRAGGLFARTLEVLDQRGVGGRFVAAGTPMPGMAFARIPLDISDFPTRHAYVLALWQRDIERLLAEWVDELGVPLRRSTEVVGFSQDDDGVDVGLSDGTTVRAAYLVGCDGGRSLVRRTAGIGFPGSEATTSWMIAEVEMDGDPPLGFHHDELGTHAIGRRAPDEPVRLVLTERELEHSREPTLADLREATVGVYGSDFGLRSASWISRFTDVARQAETYRSGRVLLAGDAAHVHPPHGGQGLNTGVQDAVNLGWKLAQVVRGTSPPSLLDTYDAERRPVGALVLRTTRAQVALARQDPQHLALHEILAELLAMDEPRQRYVGLLSGLDARYPVGEGADDAHPLAGRRVPDLDLTLDGAPTRLFTLLHDARPLLLSLTGSPLPQVPSRVRVVHASYDGVWDLPVVGEVPAPAAVLVRPDGDVAWAGDPADPGLPEAAGRWFG